MPQYLYCIAELCGREGNKLLRSDLAGHQQEEQKEEGMQRFFTVNDDADGSGASFSGLGAMASCAVGIRFRIIRDKFGRRIGRSQSRGEKRDSDVQI